MELVLYEGCGGFELSYRAVMSYAKRKGITLYAYRSTPTGIEETPYNPRNKRGLNTLYYYTRKIKVGMPLGKAYNFIFNIEKIPRYDPDLVAVVKKLGEKAFGPFSKLKIVTIPEGIEYSIENFGGREQIAEKHLIWR